MRRVRERFARPGRGAFFPNRRKSIDRHFWRRALRRRGAGSPAYGKFSMRPPRSVPRSPRHVCCPERLKSLGVLRRRHCSSLSVGLMLQRMQQRRRFALTTAFLAAVLMAAQPWIAALNLTLVAPADASELVQIVICTAHGAAILSQEGAAEQGAPTPRQKAPDCPFCAVGCGGGNAKVLLARTTTAPSPAYEPVAVIDGAIAVDHVPRVHWRLLTSPPRGPPRAA